MTDAAVRLEGVSCKIGKFQLGPLDLVAPRGSVTALVGPNGAGKTTTLDLIMGMGRPDHGRIRVLGLDQPQEEAPIKSKVAYVSPDLDFLAWGKVGRAIDFVSGFYPDWDRDRCAWLMDQFGIGRDERIAGLSFGARIKLSLVMALARRDAELLLLDEPTVGLDAAARRLLFSEILRFVAREDRAVLISSHQLTDLERLADRLIILDRGRIIASGAMDELLRRYVTVDATVRADGLVPEPMGVRLLERDGDRARLLVDRHAADPEAMAASGIRPLAEAPVTLDELVVALTSDVEA
jgi:ABC-2 type transport system ATP-binding protein